MHKKINAMTALFLTKQTSLIHSRNIITSRDHLIKTVEKM